MFNKVTSRCYSYFLKFSYYFFGREMDFSYKIRNCKIGQKTEGILGVKSKEYIVILKAKSTRI
jgi:hypothetical protein